jgi:predicted RNase H-like nuclease
VAGLDGCPAGWASVTMSVAGTGKSGVSVVTDLDCLMRGLDSGHLVAAGIDIPIGLPTSGSRRCDIEARKLIGPRRSSVFPAPMRAVLPAESYEDAAARSKAASGKSLSMQTFMILPKIREVDGLITPQRQRSFVEVHPEVSFTVMAGRPMAFPKRTSEGHNQRLAVLRKVFIDIDDHLVRKIRGASDDDVLDAFVAAWTARRYATGTHIQLGGDLDERGLRMEMIA